MRRDAERLGSMGAAALLFLSGALAVFAAPPRVAALPFENRSGDPRYDYIGAMAGGLLQFDLSSSGQVELVDRGALDAALRERELSLSAVASDPSRLSGGSLESADFLLACDYALIGKEILFTVRLIDVATTRASSFSEGGGTENAVHLLAERLVERLAGKRPSFVREGRDRSLLSLRDEAPGSIALHSPLVDAEILLDGAFVGYTTGDRRRPFVIEGVEPGVHELSTDLGRDFGTVELPEIRFGPWKEKVTVAPGKRLVATDRSEHFNGTLYRLRRVLSHSSSVQLSRGRSVVEKAFSYVDRAGAARSGSVSVELAPSADGTVWSAAVAFALDGERRSRTEPLAAEGQTEAAETIGPVEFSAKLRKRADRIDLELEAERTDVRQGMHREE